MKPLALEKVIHRFPRTDSKVTTFIGVLRAKYPAPEYDKRYDGSFNPADAVLSFLIECKRKRLRQLCFKHALETTGNKKKLIKRMYLHWRASKRMEGDPYIGYGKGFKSTRDPTCVCGFRKRADMLSEQVEKVKMAEMRKLQKNRFDELWKRAFDKDHHRRFPRLRFPRLDKEEGEVYYKDAERMFL